MRRYFYLTESNHWVGPYSFAGIIAEIVRTKIHLHTPVWSKHLSDGESEHPQKCIKRRKAAHEVLPRWLFSANIRETLRIWKKSIGKRISKDDGMAKILSKPLETGTLLNNAPVKYVLPSLTRISDFKALNKFEITLFYFTRESQVESSKHTAYTKHTDGQGFSFNIIMESIPDVGGVLFKESYGLHRSLYLQNKASTIKTGENSVKNFSTRVPYQPQQLKGNFSNLKTLTASEYNACYQRVIVPIRDTEFVGPAGSVLSTGRLICDKEAFNSHDSLIGPRFRTGISFLEMQIEGYSYQIYDLNESFMVIDSQQIMDHEVFRRHSLAIRKALGVVSGKYYADEAYYLTAQDQDFKSIEGPWFVFENETVITSRRVIDTQVFDRHKEDVKAGLSAGDRLPMSIQVFEGLCNKIVKEDEILRTVELVISAMGNSDPVQQGAMYSVALETLTGLLSKINEDKLNPVQDKEVFKRLKAELEGVVAGFSSEISVEGIQILNNKIRALNSPTNRDKLVKTFALYGINLTKEEIKTINERNTYLHGNSPLDASFAYELEQISLKLHNLILKLLLKYVGYSGHVVNLAALEFTKDETRIREYAEKVQQFSSNGLAEIKKIVEQKDFKKLSVAKEKWLKEVEQHKLPPIIEII
ncbi:hypothetical protein [Pedobacter hiemivivus]|uniref:ApeA N-terminal domain-containing protein n=1 Tax=Pedobacter hiemivivus TaxID=2530454 RepID=A0A4V2MKU9_9SPHI|nr:hypothetical protein [Pedobacter hiemivivus]TCC99536.1 hypothetical protein EZ444_02345 [Pedobacter hiemivivus]